MEKIKKYGWGAALFFVILISTVMVPVLIQPIDINCKNKPIANQEIGALGTSNTYLNGTHYKSPTQTSTFGPFDFTEGSFGTLGNITANDGDFTEINPEAYYSPNSSVTIHPNADISTNWSYYGIDFYDDILYHGSGNMTASSVDDEFQVDFDNDANLGPTEVCYQITLNIYSMVPASGWAFLEADLWGPGVDVTEQDIGVTYVGNFGQTSVSWTGLSLYDTNINNMKLNCSYSSSNPPGQDVYLDYVELVIYKHHWQFSLDVNVSIYVSDPTFYSLDTIEYDYRTTEALYCGVLIYDFFSKAWNMLEYQSSTSWITNTHALTSNQVQGQSIVLRIFTMAGNYSFDFELDMLRVGYTTFNPPDDFDFLATTGYETPEVDGDFTLSWEANAYTDNWSVLESLDGGGWLFIATGLSTNSCVITDKPYGNYSYRIRAYNDHTYTQSLTTLDLDVYGPPWDFVFATIPVLDYEDPDTDGEFTLDWEPANHADNYSIYCNGEVEVTGIPSNQTNYTIVGKGGGEYNFVVKAINQYGIKNSNSSVTIWVEQGANWQEPVTYIAIIGGIAGVAIGVPLAIVSKRKKAKAKRKKAKAKRE